MKNNIKNLRAEKRLSQLDLAMAAGMSRVTLTMIENDKADPDGLTIVKLVRALNVPANKIFFDLDVV